MSTSSNNNSKASKWLSNKSFKLSLHLLKRPKPGSSATPPPSPGVGGRGREFHEAFRLFDADGDGKISSGELRAFLAWAGESVAAGEADRVVAELDSDGDGLMDYGDFMRLMMERNGGGGGGGGGGDEDLRRAFEMFEVEKGSGCITPKGLQRVLSRLGDVKTSEECAAMIRAYDLDGNGVLDFDEFQRMMSN
ncbi:probable calcium-binding protein CML41 [Typha angustifolia]|uniref:probable calcium-binding protein CML41 n=1 Tax=Typha angustifolia TaxID=59011 RepID=UPI003C2F7C32